jgi:hypothetical protein
MSHPIYPAADCFPMLGDDELLAMAEDIKVNGLIRPIELWRDADGKEWLIDGRNRQRACEQAGIAPRYQEIKTPDPIAYVIAANIHRRHLTTAQRAAIAADLATMKHGNATFGKKKHTEGTEGSFDPLVDEMSIDQAAKLMSVSAPSVKRAKKRKAADPQAHESIKRGEKPPKAENKDMGSSNRTYRTIGKVMRTQYTNLTGEVFNPAWFYENIKPYIRDRLQWTASHNWAKEITEEQGKEVAEIVAQYIEENNRSKLTPGEAEVTALKSAGALSIVERSALDKAIAAHQRHLDMQMEERIKERLQSALDMYVKEYDRYKEFNDAWKGLLTDDEYRLVISCLHPDRAPPDRVKQYEKAFHIVKSKEDVLLAARPDSGPSTMPRTVEELMARRNRH